MSKVILRAVMDMETGEILERVSMDYEGPWALAKESDAQKQAQQQQTQFNQQLQKIYMTQYEEQQGVFLPLSAQLQAMAANPQGMGSTEFNALQASIINTTGQQYANTAKQAATQFAVSNEAGLPSGVEAQVQGQIAGQAAGQVAAQSSALNIANEQLKQEQQQFAESQLTNLSGQMGTFAGQTANQELSGINNQFNQATQVFNQGSLWQNILGGVVGAGLNFATGGLSGILTQAGPAGAGIGGQFLAGAGAKLGGVQA